MKSILRVVSIFLLIAFIVIQFFRIDNTTPAVDPSSDFLTMHEPPADVETILRTACYDCHSYETTYPWYTNIQPVGWWLQGHIDEGRDEMNLSTWENYSPEDADHYLEEIVEVVDEEEMPLPSYTWAHSEARLTDEQRDILTNWVAEFRTSLQQSSDTSATTGTGN